MADLDLPGHVDESGGSAQAVHVLSACSMSSVVSQGTMLDGLLRELDMLSLGAGGAGPSSGGGSSGPDAPGVKWPGDTCMSFCLHIIEVGPRVANGVTQTWAHGWQHLANDQYVHQQCGGVAVVDMPITQCWQTMSRYSSCATMMHEEGRQVKELPMLDGENPVAYATRLSVMAQAVRDVCASKPVSAGFACGCEQCLLTQ